MDYNQQGQPVPLRQQEQNNFQTQNPIQDPNQLQNYPNYQPSVPGVNPAPLKKSNKAKIFIIIAIVAIVIIAGIAVLVYHLFGSEVVGDWECQDIDSDQLSVRMQLNGDGTFVFGSYQDLANNHFSGTYKAEYDANKTFEVSSTGVGNANWYNFKFTTTEFIRDGVQQSVEGHGLADATMAIEEYGNGKKATVLFGYSGYYFCFTK